MNAVVYSNGDVSLCEQHAPIGNLREHTFDEIWNSDQANALRKSIAAKECYCTNEVFLWPSMTYQPFQLARAMVNAKVWRGVQPLSDEDRKRSTEASTMPSPDDELLIQIKGQSAAR